MDKYKLEEVIMLIKKNLLTPDVLENILKSTTRRIETYDDSEAVEILNYLSNYESIPKEIKEENKDLRYFVDLHRDSVSKDISTIEINGKKYAKILFILGLENESYKKNEVVISKLNDWLDRNYKGISRGIYRKKGTGVNGVYNQDFSENCILIEIGGEANTYEEVENTIDVIAEMLNFYIGGDSD